MSVKSLISDPDFDKLAPGEKKTVLATVDPEFSSLADNEVDLVVKGIRDSSSDKPKTALGLAKNTLKDYAANAAGPALAGAFTFPPLAAAQLGAGKNIYDANMLKQIPGAAVQGIKSLPGQIANSVLHPIDSFYKQPLSTALNLDTVAGAAAGAANIARPIASSIAKKVLPGTLRATTGIPEMATKLALDKPEIFNTPPVAPEQLNQAVGDPVIKAMQAAKAKAGDAIGKTFRKYADMEGPKQEIVNTPTAQKLIPIKKDVPIAQKLNLIENKDVGTGMTTKKLVPGDVVTESKVTGFKPGEEIAIQRPQTSYSDLLVNVKKADRAFNNGDQAALDSLFKQYVSPNAKTGEMTIRTEDKAQILTRLKREAQQQAQFNKAPITNAPIDAAKDAAFKEMSSKLDSMRTNLPGGAELSKADDAWKNINDIFDSIQKDLSDPGKARDTMTKLMKGDTSFLTQGRMAGKVEAIKRVEREMGKPILQPAMEEMTRQFFNDPSGKGFVSRIFQGGTLAGLGASIAHPALLPGVVATAAMSSPQFIRGAIKAADKTGSALKMIAPGVALGAAGSAATTVGKTAVKVLTDEKKAREYLKKAKGDPNKARTLAKADGYEIGQ